MLPTTYLKLAGAVALAVVCVLAGRTWEHRAHVTEVAQLKAAVVKQQMELQSFGVAAQKVEDARHAAQTQAVAAVDTQRTQELSDARTEIDAHRAGVASGAERVRVLSAQCAARSPDRGGMPPAAAGPSVADAAAVELSPAGGQLVLDLKAAIAEDQVKIKGLQDYIRALSVAAP